jgi:hypothetical protein
MKVLNAMQMKAGAKSEYNRMGSLTQPIQFIPRKEKDEDWTAWTSIGCPEYSFHWSETR